jgi:hypothetical protein
MSNQGLAGVENMLKTTEQIMHHLEVPVTNRCYRTEEQKRVHGNFHFKKTISETWRVLNRRENEPCRKDKALEPGQSTEKNPSTGFGVHIDKRSYLGRFHE